MTHWTSHDWRAFGVRECEVVGHRRSKCIIKFFGDGMGSVWVPKRWVFQSMADALAHATEMKNKHAEQQIRYWQRVLEDKVKATE